MALSLLIAILLFIIVLAGIFVYRWRANYGTVGSFAAALAALMLFLMAVGIVHF